VLPSPVELRIHIYDVLLDRGAPPRVAELAREFNVSENAARNAIADLKIGKTVLPHPQTGEVWMAGPFAAESTGYKVAGKRTTWFANCAWDMLGVAMIAREWVSIETTCGDCGEPIRLSADHESPARDALVVHFLVPARRWYDDVGFT
jgi:hypothetical protein